MIIFQKQTMGMKSNLGIQIIVSALTAGLVYFGLHKLDNSHQTNSSPLSSNTAQDGLLNKFLMSDRFNSKLLSAYPNNFVTAAQLSTPAVVYIETSRNKETDHFLEPFQKSGSGSGVIISNNGMIVTNYHVIEEAESISVLLNDQREYKAKLLGTDPGTDLALLKIEEENLPFVVFGNSDSLLVGEWVLAVGNPFRLQSTVTAGIVSAKARNIQILNSRQYSIESFIQTDAAVNPGNSGGALVNSMGELVGINTAIMSTSGRYEGYSFSIPSNLVRKVISDIQEYGAVQRGLLGIMIQNVTNESAKQLKLSKVEGVQVSSITPEGAADASGLKIDDVILKINNRNVKTVPELQEIVAGFRPGDQIQIQYSRNGEVQSTVATLRNQANTLDLITTRKDKILTDLGFELRNLTEAERKMIKQEGIKVLSIYQNSIISKTNMSPSFIITKINGHKINNVDDFIKELESADDSVLLHGVYENYKGIFPYQFKLK